MYLDGAKETRVLFRKGGEGKTGEDMAGRKPGREGWKEGWKGRQEGRVEREGWKRGLEGSEGRD